MRDTNVLPEVNESYLCGNRGLEVIIGVNVVQRAVKQRTVEVGESESMAPHLRVYKTSLSTYQ
jgi:hypothetical protein